MATGLTTLACVLAATLVATVVASPATARDIEHSDGNDARGPLDLSGVAVQHVQDRSSFRITTRRAFKNADVGVKNRRLRGFFELGLDTGVNGRFDYFVQVVHFKGRFQGWMFKPRGDYFVRLDASRVSANAVEVSLPHHRIRNKGSWQFSVLSAYFASPCSKKHPCVDQIPNHPPLIRDDFTPPTVSDWNTDATYSSTVSATLANVPISFSVNDDPLGSGVESWTLQSQKAGTSSWVDVDSGSVLSPTVNVSGEEGATYQFRVNAVDNQGNVSSNTAPSRVSFPYDDRNALLTYSSATRHDGVPGAFLGTTSAVAHNETMTFTTPFQVGWECILVGPTSGTGSGQVEFGNVSWGFFEDENTPARTPFCTGYVIPAGTEVTLSVPEPDKEPVVVDGVILIPFP